MKDAQLECLSGQIENLRSRLTAAIRTSEGDLHAPIVQALSRKIDAMIVEFARHGTRRPETGDRVPAPAGEAQPGGGRVSGMRRSGIAAVGDVPWGTHLCQFYRTEDDLVHTLVPYFATGLEDHELCVWVVSAPLSTDEARDAMARSVRSLPAYLDSGQLQIIQDADWYFAREPLDVRHIADAWLAKLDEALEGGYEGMRLAGHPGRQIKARGDWSRFVEYERYVDAHFGGLQIMAFCGYPLDACGPRETADAVRSHGLVLLEHEGEWQAV